MKIDTKIDIGQETLKRVYIDVKPSRKTLIGFGLTIAGIGLSLYGAYIDGFKNYDSSYNRTLEDLGLISDFYVE